MKPPKLLNKSSLLAMIILTLLVACNNTGINPGTSTITPTSLPATPTALPSPTALPPAVWIIAPETADPAITDQITAVLAQENGITLDTYAQFISEDVTPEVKLVIVLGPLSDLSAWAAALPEVQFLGIGSGLSEVSENISFIDDQLAQRTFVAGYIATLIAPDFRSGALFVENDPNLALKQDSFLNGGHYLCGRCVPVYTPLVLFPQTATLPDGADIAALQTGFDQLNQNRVEVLAVPVEGMLPEFLTSLVNQNVLLLGWQAPPSEFKNQWIVTISMDATSALTTMIPELLKGNGGQQAIADLVLADVNEAYLSTGKMLMLNPIIDDLKNNRIIPLSIP